jgi:hypothetical protein
MTNSSQGPEWDKSSVRAAWASALAASLSAVVAIITVIILILQTNAMRQQVNVMQQQVDAAFSSFRYNKQLELETSFVENYRDFKDVAYFVPFYADIDHKDGKGSSTNKTLQSVNYLITSFEEIKKRSDQLSKTVALFEVWFPKKLFDWATTMSNYIDGQVDDYNTMIKDKTISPDKILNNVKKRKEILGGDPDMRYRDYLNFSPYRARLVDCFEKTTSQGHPIVDDKTLVDKIKQMIPP